MSGYSISPAVIASFLYHDVTDDPAESGFQRPSALPYKHNIGEFSQNLDQIESSPLIPGYVADIELAPTACGPV